MKRCLVISVCFLLNVFSFTYAAEDSCQPNRDDSAARDQHQDSDGLTAWQEFLIGTDAANPAAPVANQRPTTTTLYNKVGKPIAAQDARGNWSRSFYDRAYRVMFTRINPSTGSPSSAPDPGTNNAFDIVAQTSFDKNGNPIAVTDGNGNITRNAFDALNRQIVTSVSPASGNPTDPNGSGYTASTYQLAGGITGDIVTSTLYDDAGNIVRITDGQGRTIDYRYDGLKRKTHTIWDIGTTLARTETLGYDGVLQTTRTDSNGRITNYGYDSLHRLTNVTYPSRTQDKRTNSYDLANNLLSVTYPNESAANKLRRQCSSTFDHLNRQLTETSNEVTTTTTFDKAGNTLTKQYGQTNRLITSQYDDLNRLESCTENGRSTYYDFDLNGNTTRNTLPNGQYTDKTFDALNRTIKSITKTLLHVTIVSTDSTAAVSPYPSGYDNVGNLLKTTEEYAHGQVKNRILTNSYGKAYRLTNEILDQSAAGGTVKTTAYQYDRSNNRHRKTVTTGATVTEDYAHNYGDGSNGANSNQLISFGPWGGTTTHTFTYDANVSRLTLATNGRTDTYLYDDEKRLISLDYQTDTNAAKRGLHLYQYDHRTRRVTRDESAITGTSGIDTRLAFADGLSIQEHDGGTITTSPTVEYIRGSDYGGGIGGVLYTLRNNIPRYNAYNYRGDVTTTTDANATINWQAAYEAFGTRPQEAGTNPERQRGNTKDEDPTGLLNENKRYRDLLTGTFITRDPLGVVDGPNEYCYVVCNPWSKFDPDGLKEKKPTGVVQEEVDERGKKGGLSKDLKMEGGTIIANRNDKLLKQIPKGVTKEQALQKIVGKSGRVILVENQERALAELKKHGVADGKPLIVYDHGIQHYSPSGNTVEKVTLRMGGEPLTDDVVKQMAAQTNKIIFCNCAAAAEGNTSIKSQSKRVAEDIFFKLGNRDKFVKMVKNSPNLTVMAATDYVWSKTGWANIPGANAPLFDRFTVNTANKTWIKTSYQSLTSTQYKNLNEKGRKIFKNTIKK